MADPSAKPATLAKEAKLRIFVAPCDLAASKIVRLNHPRTKTPMSVAIAAENTRLLEIQRFSESEKGELRSWLLAGAERVQQDGSLFVATPLDPLFLLLPRLRVLRGSTSENGRGYFRPMSELSSTGGGDEEEQAFEATVLAMPEPLLLKRLRAICDVNDKYDEPMLRLNDAKVEAWLRRKAEALKAALDADATLKAAAAKRVADAHTSQFDDIVGVDGPVASATDAKAGGGAATAVALVAEYLEPLWQARLCEAFSVSEAAVTQQRGPEKKPAPAGVGAPGGSWGGEVGGGAAASSWAADLADADAEVDRMRGEGAAPNKRPNSSMENEPPAVKKAKPAPAAKSKTANLPLKKGQQTMMGFFKK